MFLNPTEGIPPQLIALAVAATGGVIGLLWIRSITNFDEGLSTFRYRTAGPAAPEWPTWRWTFTRLALILGRVSLIVPVLAVLAPNGPRAMVSGPDYSPAATIIGCVGLVIGNVWLHRIAHADPEAGPSRWRYRR